MNETTTPKINNYGKRCVHLDFHTSPDIKNIGARFSKENFQAALKKGHVDSITVFAKCHHGFCYFPTKVGVKHPHVDFDLTGAMIEAAHEIGVKAPVYITTGWSENDAIEHPEWRVKKADGAYAMMNNAIADEFSDKPRPYVSWTQLCLNDGAYAKHIYALIHEICARYNELDGLFFDICVVGNECYCDECRQGMRDMGLNENDPEDAHRYFVIKRRDFMRKCNEILKAYHPNATIFFNSGGASIEKPEYHEYQSHFEMEDLPTAWGGYDKLPLRAKFFKEKGKHYIGMTGKFHLDWGEFGGFKDKKALRYEVAAMSLYGAGCSIGDHMHPDGEMDMQTYENIGYAYEYLEKIEEYVGGSSTANIGIYNGKLNIGLSNMLLEAQYDFDIVFNNEFHKYDVVIFDEGSSLDEAGENALKAYVNGGGKVLFMGDSLIKNGKFVLDCGLSYLGKCQYDCDYLSLDKDAVTELDIPRSPVLCLDTSTRISVNEGEIHGWVTEPYFSRTYKHFCGHKNTPDDKNSTPYPAIVKNGNVVYTAHPLSTLYGKYGAVAHKRLFLYALGLIFDAPVADVKLPTQGRMTMVKQTEKKRYCLNLTYASPVKRGCAEIIEDIVPIYDIPVKLRINEKAKRVYSAYDGEDIPFSNTEGTVSFNVPKLEGHKIIVIEY